MPAQTIDEVIDQLEQIIQNCIADKSPLGYFAALYQKVTIAVKQGIANGHFEDGKQMEQLDVVFANRYLEAFAKYQNGEQTTKSWTIAFDAAQKNDLIILQHLFLGINAHINLDLGLATAEIMKGKNLEIVKSDFEMINTILFELMKEVQTAIGMVSPLLFLADIVSDEQDEKLAAFSLRTSRDHAWRVAQRFHEISEANYGKELNALDFAVAKFADLLQPEGWLKRVLFQVVRLLESKDRVRVIENLHGEPRRI